MTTLIHGSWLRARRRNHRNWSLWHYIPTGTDSSLCGNFHPSRCSRHERPDQDQHVGGECRKCLEQLRWQLARTQVRESLYRRASRRLTKGTTT